MRRIIVDFDNTMVKSSKAILDLYNKRTHSNIEYTDNHGWNFEGLIPKEHSQEVKRWFNQDEFYEVLEPMDKAVEYLELLSKNNEIIVCTKHDFRYMQMKKRYIYEYFPFIDNVICLSRFNKSFIGNKNDIKIDDRLECLKGSECETNILFGNYGYNQKEINGIKYERFVCWEDIYKTITLREMFD